MVHCLHRNARIPTTVAPPIALHSKYNKIKLCTPSHFTLKMKGISDLLDSDMEHSAQHLIDENSILSTASEAPSIKPSKKQASRKEVVNRVTKVKVAPRKPKSSSGDCTKKASSKGTGAKRKALEEHVNGTVTQAQQDRPRKQDGHAGDFEDELESPKTIMEQASEVAPKAKGSKDKKATLRKAVEEGFEEIDQTPLIERSSKLQQAVVKTAPKIVSKASKEHRPKQDETSARVLMPESQPEPIETETGANTTLEPMRRQQAKISARAEGKTKQENTFRRRVGSASDTERGGGDPNLRRKLGDITRKFENIDLKYRNLKDVGVSEANTNMDKLRKQCETATAASNDLVASLKKELAMQKPLAQESRKLQKSLQAKELEATELQANVAELTKSLATAQNEIKALQAKLAASRSISTTIESANCKTPASALKNNGPARTVMVGSAEAAQAAQIAQLKEELYSDLTGLIVRNVKRSEDGDTYDCIQTGRNGSKY